MIILLSMTTSYIKPEFELIELIPGSALQTSGIDENDTTDLEEGGELS